jgi:hypothetical protein
MAQNGHGILSLSLEKRRELFTSTWFYDVITDASLIHGQLRFEHRLIERLPQWSDFWEFWHRVTKSHPYPHTIQKNNIERLIPNSLPKPVSASSPQVESSVLKKVFNLFGIWKE